MYFTSPIHSLAVTLDNLEAFEIPQLSHICGEVLTDSQVGQRYAGSEVNWVQQSLQWVHLQLTIVSKDLWEAERGPNMCSLSENWALDAHNDLFEIVPAVGGNEFQHVACSNLSRSISEVNDKFLEELHCDENTEQPDCECVILWLKNLITGSADVYD